jgi:cell division protein FtsW (lipid II flippase)
LKKGRVGLVLKSIFIYSVLGVLFFIMLLKVFPTNTQYFIARFSEITTPKSTREQNNLNIRFINTGIIISNIDDKNKFLGMGPVTENQLLWVTNMKQATADMVWAGVIFRWGFVGLILFIILYIYSVIKAYNIYMKSEGVLSELALLFLLYIVSQMIQSFIDWTFLSGHGPTIGLWYLAMLSALIGFDKNTGLLDEKTVLELE